MGGLSKELSVQKHRGLCPRESRRFKRKVTFELDLEGWAGVCQVNEMISI